jgi:hypothetical protein
MTPKLLPGLNAADELVLTGAATAVFELVAEVVPWELFGTVIVGDEPSVVWDPAVMLVERPLEIPEELEELAPTVDSSTTKVRICVRRVKSAQLDVGGDYTHMESQSRHRRNCCVSYNSGSYNCSRGRVYVPALANDITQVTSRLRDICIICVACACVIDARKAGSNKHKRF